MFVLFILMSQYRSLFFVHGNDVVNNNIFLYISNNNFPLNIDYILNCRLMMLNCRMMFQFLYVLPNDGQFFIQSIFRAFLLYLGTIAFKSVAISCAPKLHLDYSSFIIKIV